MGFAAVFLQIMSLLYFLKFPQTYTQISFSYPQTIVTNKKRVGKTSYSFSTRCE